MDSSVLAAIVALVILVALSAFFSASETSITSVSKIKLKNLVKDGNKKAERALKISDDYEKFLTTILVGNNLVNILSSALCTWLFTKQFGDVGVAYATVFMLVVILLVSEITPKTIAKNNPEMWSMRFAPAISFFIIVLSPLTFVFVKLTGSFFKVEEEPTLTEEELVTMIDEIEEEGTLEEDESKLIKSAIEFDDKEVSEILTPRVDVVGIEKDSSMEDLKELFLSSGFSRIPVYDQTIDSILGVIYAKDFYSKYFRNIRVNMTDLMRQVKYIPETLTVAETLTEIQKSMTQMAIVVDSYGGTVGVVTLEDILEELVGEIWDESDEVQYPIIKESDDTFAVLGEANINDLMEEIGVEFDLDGYDDYTVGGYVQYVLNRIPIKGDRIENDRIKIIVRSVKDRRVKLVHVTVKPVVEEES